MVQGGYEYLKTKLQQRFPLMMVDRVRELAEDHSYIRTVKNISGNEICFLGHFPHFSIFPGVLIIEAMAQSASVLFASDEAPSEDDLYLLGSVGNTRFLHPVFPGDQMEIRIDIIKRVPDACLVSGQVHVDGLLVAEGKLSFARRNRNGWEDK